MPEILPGFDIPFTYPAIGLQSHSVVAQTSYGK